MPLLSKGGYRNPGSSQRLWRLAERHRGMAKLRGAGGSEHGPIPSEFAMRVVGPGKFRGSGPNRIDQPGQAPAGKVIEVRVNTLELEQNDHIAGQMTTAAERGAEATAMANPAGRAEMAVPCYDFAAIYDGPKVG